jgi:hypothetical protein
MALSGCANHKPYEKGLKLDQIISEKKDYKVGNITKTGWQLAITKNTFDEDINLLMQVLSKEENEAYISEAFHMIGTAVKITAGDEESVRLNHPVIVSMKLPQSTKISKEEVDNYVIGYWSGDNWEYIIPSSIDLQKGIVIFETYHFSLFATVKLTEEEKIKLYAKKMALQTWEEEENEKVLSDKVQDVFKETFESMGISDSSMQGKLFRSIAKEYDFGALLVSSERGDLVDFSAKCGEMAANAILKHYRLDDKFMENIAGKGAAAVAGIGKAALQLKDGNYTDAVKELSSAFIGYFPAGRAYQATYEIYEAGIASWKDYELDAAYKSYQGLVKEGAFGYKIHQGDWDTLCIQMRGYLTRLQEEAKNEYCLVNNMSRNEFDKDEALGRRIADQAISALKTKFEKRYTNEQNIQSKESEHYKIIEGFKRDGLLTRGSFGFAFDMDIEDRLRMLYAARDNILNMFEGEMPVLQAGESAEENLNQAVAQWISFGPRNRAEFYQWLIDKGYKSQVKLVGGGFAWVLVEVEDFESKDHWALNNEHVSYAYEYSYSQGSYSAKSIYEGESDDYYNPPVINGEALAAQAIYSPAPEVIYADQPVTLTLALTVTEDSQSFFNFSASANASFDEPGIEAGYGTGGAISFVNAEGEYYFQVSSDNTTVNETLTAQLSAGMPGKRMALRTSFYMGVPMCTNYVYEWKEQ